MSWSHSSKLGLAAVVVILTVAVVGVASGVTVSDPSVPDSAEVDQQITITYELTDLYADSGNYTLGGHTGLENATWTIEHERDGEVVHTDTFDVSRIPYGEVRIDESASDAPDTVVVEITGTVPQVETYSYDDPATFDAAVLGQVIGSDASVFEEAAVRQYTTGDPGSQSARTALDDAQSAIQSADQDGDDVSQAQSTFDEAVSAYDGGNFAETVSLAEDAQSQAESADSGSDGTDDGSGDDGSSNDGSSDGGDSTNGSDGSGSTNDSDSGTDGTDSSDGSTNGSDAGTDGSGTNTDDGTAANDTDGENASAGDSSGSSDDGGLLSVVLYGVFGLLILGGVGGGVYWYLQRDQGPSRDPLG